MMMNQNPNAWQGGYNTQYGGYTPPAMDNLAIMRAPYQQNVPQPPQAGSDGQYNGQGGIIWVRGEEGAKAFPVARGQSVQLFDSEANVFYIVAVDMSGMPLPIRTFDFVERTATQPKASAAAQAAPVDYVPMETYKSLVMQCEALEKQVEKLAKRLDDMQLPIIPKDGDING